MITNIPPIVVADNVENKGNSKPSGNDDYRLHLLRDNNDKKTNGKNNEKK